MRPGGGFCLGRWTAPMKATADETLLNFVCERNVLCPLTRVLRGAGPAITRILRLTLQR